MLGPAAIPAVFAVTYTALAGSLYFALGVVAKHAMGLTPVVFLVAGLFFGIAALTYMEGVARHPAKGGSTVFARHGFNELISFIAGWAVLLDYTLLIAVTALSATNYLAVFWAPLGGGTAGIVSTMVIIGYVAVRNIRGFGEGRGRWMPLIVVADVLLLVVLVVAGLATFWNVDVLTAGIELGSAPTWGGLVFALGVATIVFTGLESATSLAGEVTADDHTLRRLVQSVTAVVLTVYVGTALVAVTALPFSSGRSELVEDHLGAPLVGIAQSFGGWAGHALEYAVAVIAAITLVAAANSAMLGLSRLAYSLSRNRQIPALLGRLHTTRSTPIITIVLAALGACALVLPQSVEMLVGIYAFGALLGITIAHASVIAMRYREPSVRPAFEVPWSVPFRGGRLPLPALVGLVTSFAVWISVIATHPAARYVGSGWVIAGIVFYVVYRLSQGKPLLRRVTVPEDALHGERTRVEYGTILVPLTGTQIDDDMMQTAGRLAADTGDRREQPDEPTTIEAIWIHEIPVALPIDAPVGDEGLKRARAALLRAKAVGEEYNGVEVATATVRGRRAGAVIVEEARRRGVEVIVMAAEEPSRIRGGPILGGLPGARDNYVGEATKYVVAKAPCSVLLTAPPTAETQARSDRIASELAAARARTAPVPDGSLSARPNVGGR